MQTLNYIPEVLQNIKEFKVIAECCDMENEDLVAAAEDLYNDQFIYTAKKGIERYEKIVGIESKKTETPEERKLGIIAAYNKQLPYTMTVLKKNLDTFCGKNGYSIDIDYTNKVLTVKINLTAKSMFDTVEAYLEEVVPVDLIIDLLLLYNTHKITSQYTHGQLAGHTHHSLKEEVIQWQRKQIT